MAPKGDNLEKRKRKRKGKTRKKERKTDLKEKWLAMVVKISD